MCFKNIEHNNSLFGKVSTFIPLNSANNFPSASKSTRASHLKIV